MKKKYPIVTLCGSTRFKKEFEEVQKRLTLDGYIVISVGLFGHSGDEEVWEDKSEGQITETKKMLDDMHKHKILKADYIFVIDPNGYVGESTRSEIRFASMVEKKIAFYHEYEGKPIRNIRWNKIDSSSVYADIEKAAYLSWTMTDSMIHRGADSGDEPFIVHKNEKIYDPFADPDKAYTDSPTANHYDDLTEPFRIYGKEKMAFFIESILAMNKEKL